MSIKLTDSEKLERLLMRRFERHFRNYGLYFGKSEATKNYVDNRTYLMFLAYEAGYNKGKTNKL